MPLAAPEIADRLVMLTATTKTFNIAGAHTGNVIIPDDDLRRRFAARACARGHLAQLLRHADGDRRLLAEGAAWVDALCRLPRRQPPRCSTRASPRSPACASMPLEATYLAWVDFSGTGMAPAEFTARVEKDARIAANHGASFGDGGEDWLRFNLGTPRARVEEAVGRLQAAFADLQ